METNIVVDQMGRKVHVPKLPTRIVSLVPSQTELLFDLGLNEMVIGITKFCIHPKEWHKEKTKVGGTKNVKHDVIKSLNPDLIIGNKEENLEADILKLSKHFPVWMSDIKSLEDALQMIQQVSEITLRKNVGDTISHRINQSFDKLKPPLKFKPKALYLIWNKPYMAAGKNTFIDDMLQRCGMKNSLDTTNNRYPTIDDKWISRNKPDVILLSSEPFPFHKKHAREVQAIFPDSQIICVDGELFSWYGSRLLHSADYFDQLMQDVQRRVGQQ